MRAKSSKQPSRWYTAPARLERNAEYLPQTSPDGDGDRLDIRIARPTKERGSESVS